MRQLVVLDTFCGGGGASKGYHDAGYHVVGVDIEPQPNYPYEFHQADALDFIAIHGQEFDLVHASPPCQRYSMITKTAGTQYDHPDLVPDTRLALQSCGRPYVIENVKGAPLINPLMLCGTMFGIPEVRHRYFECSPVIWFPPMACAHGLKVVKHGRPPNRKTNFHGISGHFSDVEWAREIRGTPWMTSKELAQSIPPAYTQWIGEYYYEFLISSSANLQPRGNQ